MFIYYRATDNCCEKMCVMLVPHLFRVKFSIGLFNIADRSRRRLGEISYKEPNSKK